MLSKCVLTKFALFFVRKQVKVQKCPVTWSKRIIEYKVLRNKLYIIKISYVPMPPPYHPMCRCGVARPNQGD